MAPEPPDSIHACDAEGQVFVTQKQQGTNPGDETLVETLEPSTVQSLADGIPQAIVAVRGEVSLEHFEGLTRCST